MFTFYKVDRDPEEPPEGPLRFKLPEGFDINSIPPERRCDFRSVGPELVEREPFVTRALWGAKDPLKPFEERVGPPGRIFVVDTQGEQCKTRQQCLTRVKEIQEEMMYEKGEDDLPYNFLVGADGRVYEGRGWRARLPIPFSLPEEYEDGTHFVIGFIGDFSEETGGRPPEKMVKARREFVMYGKDIGVFDKKIEIFTNIQWKV